MNTTNLPTPCFLVDTALIERNLQTLRGVARRTGCKILLAQKAFSMHALYPLIGEYLSGATSSGLYEARLAHEQMRGENHVFSAAYRPDEFEEIASICGHIVFNSFAQLERYGRAARDKGTSIGIRVNPEHSTQQGKGIYDPCAPGSRLGVTREEFNPELFRMYEVEGLHFHTLCEQNADDLITTLAAFEEKFGEFMPGLRWLNLGGGHHITRPDYDIPALQGCVTRLREKYGVEVYLEPGEAIALNAGYLITTVLDIVRNGMEIAILDTSAACHMPDVLEGPYRPPLQDSGYPGEKAHTYRLGGPTCLAGDIIGDYSFDRPLQVGDRLIFEDMAIYSMVKTNTFNGMGLPAIALLEDGQARIIKAFGYKDFKERLS